MRKTLRRSCAACAKAKHGCDLRTPKCSRCLKRNSNCIYANEPLTSTITPVEDIGDGLRVLYGSKSRTESLFSIRSGGSTSADLSDLSVSLDAHLFDPFYSYPSTNLPRLRVQGLMQHFLSKIAFQYYPLDLSPSSNPFVTSWWPLALNDPALFHVTLQTASLDDELHARKGFAQSELLMKDSISLLRQKIQDQSLAFQDATMNAVVTLAAIEHGKGNLQVSKVHIDGVKRMVTVRGGLLKVKETSPLTARMVPWVSLLVTETPQFETQDDFGLGDGISALHQWKNGSVARWEPNILDFDALGLDPDLVNIVARLRSVFQDRLVLSATDLHDLTCFALHRLMSLPSLTSADSRSSNVSTCLRYAVSAYMFIIHGVTYYSHLHILNAIIIQLQCHIDTLLLSTKRENSLLVWLLSVGAVASTVTSESQWFRTQAAAISGALGFQCWHDVVRHLKRVLWYETGSKILFEQTWEEILTSTSTLHSLATPEGTEQPQGLSDIQV